MGLDRFRDLERAGETGRKDAALLAAIAGFETLRHPTPQDEKQFSNLVAGLFPHTRAETRRIAAAALSQLPAVPESVAVMVADQPAATATPFLSFSETIDTSLLLAVIARHGVGHARAIARRPSLTPVVITALLELNDSEIDDLLAARGLGKADSHRRDQEEALRARLKDMALGRDSSPTKHDNALKKTHSDASTAQGNAEQVNALGALLAKQASRRDPATFAQCLALALRADRSLGERLMLDLSGTQLATALQGLSIGEVHATAVLEGVFPHLTGRTQGTRHSQLLLAALDPGESMRKVDAWRRAAKDPHRPTLMPLITEAAGRSTAERPATPTKRRGGAVSRRVRQA